MCHSSHATQQKLEFFSFKLVQTSPLLNSRLYSIIPLLVIRLGTQFRRLTGDTSAMEVLPTEIDVICGSGNDISQHPGNIRFRLILANHYQQYSEAATRTEKVKVTRAAYDEVIRPGARFLKKDPIFQKWFLASPKVGRDKISYTLRGASSKVGRDKISHPFREIRMANQAPGRGLAVQHQEKFVVNDNYKQQIAVLMGGETKEVNEEQLQQLSYHIPVLLHESRKSVAQPQYVMGTFNVVSDFLSSPSLESSHFLEEHEHHRLPPVENLTPFSMMAGLEQEQVQANHEASFDTSSCTMAASQLSTALMACDWMAHRIQDS